VAVTNVTTLPDDQWVQIVNASDLFYLTLVSGPIPYVAATLLNAEPSPHQGHVLTDHSKNKISRSDLGNGYVWIRSRGLSVPTTYALTLGIGQLTYEGFEVSDGAGAFEAFQVSDGVGGHENYEVIQ